MNRTHLIQLFCFLALNGPIYSAQVVNQFTHGEDLIFSQLDNGIMTIVQSSKTTPNHASFRVVVKRTILDTIDQNVSFSDNFDQCFSEQSFVPKDYAFIMRSLVSSEQTIYALDAPINNKRIGDFLSFCSKKIALTMQEELTEEVKTSPGKSPIWMSANEQTAFFLAHDLDQVFPLFTPNQIIGIAIGDFEPKAMSEALNKTLSLGLDTLQEDEDDEWETIDQRYTLHSQNESFDYWNRYLSYFPREEYSCSTQLMRIGSSIQQGIELYQALPFSDAEKAVIMNIINTLADYNIFELAFHRGDLMRKGEKIRHVHPFRFMGLVFSNPQLKKNMEKISDSYFKWNGFIDGFSEKINDEANKNNLMKYLPGLENHLGIDHDTLTPFILKREWDKLIMFLINHRK